MSLMPHLCQTPSFQKYNQTFASNMQDQQRLTVGLACKTSALNAFFNPIEAVNTMKCSHMPNLSNSNAKPSMTSTKKCNSLRLNQISHSNNWRKSLRIYKQCNGNHFVKQRIRLEQLNSLYKKNMNKQYNSRSTNLKCEWRMLTCDLNFCKEDMSSHIERSVLRLISTCLKCLATR